MREGRSETMTRGQLLLERRRPEDAAAAFMQVLAQQPDYTEAHFWLALALMQIPDRMKDALVAIEAAIALDPEAPLLHAYRSRILTILRRTREAHQAADSAMHLDPDGNLAYIAKAEVCCEEKQWAEAERYLLIALNREPDDELAGNLMAHTLRMQGKLEQNQATIEKLLAEDPNSCMGHCNAGWSCLQQSRYEDAETHFAEALRLDPEFEAARAGLLESFRARSPIYRSYLKYCFWMQRFTAGRQFIIIIGLIIAVRVLREVLGRISPLAGGLLVFAYIMLVLWVWVASGIGNLVVLCDRKARVALNSGERMEAICVGGGLIAGLCLLGAGVLFGKTPLQMIGITMMVASVPGALAFTNPSPLGRRLFTGMFAAGWALGVMIALSAMGLFEAPVLDTLLGGYILLCVVCTWLGNIPSLRRAPVG